MTGKFEWFTDKAGKWRWHLLAGNGQIIATSQGYKSKQACMDGIESVRKNAPGAPVVENQPATMMANA
ncbi:YegP family protein [Yinghuangia seranimata]|uniref:YegP family protein n=1 Tax=Yinghuangia seranimata TaxID=408067 RepID=UPI00248BA51F|nr:YegP family protein [Yinghuangia seranimata]MDI2128610.1 YegP family protein [Yinghuangia seranimata]